MPNAFSVLDQHDFSAGELDPTVKRRDDDPFVRKGARQLANGRTLNSGGVTNRPGRNLLQALSGQARVQEVLIAPGVKYRFSFTGAHLTIFDTTGTQVFGEAGRAWAANTLGKIRFAVYLKQVFITFPGAVPEVLTWDGASAWASASFAEAVIGSQKRTPFYRLSPQGVLMTPTALTGAGVVCAFSADILQAGHVGTRMRFCGRQILITQVTNAHLAVITIEESLPGSQTIGFATDPSTVFSLQDEVVGANSGAKGIVVAINTGGTNITVQLLTLASQIVPGLAPGTISSFAPPENIIGPGGALASNGATTITPPAAVSIWDDEVMNPLRGYPSSVFVDQGRLGFCNFPAVPGAIAWSAIGVPTDLNVGANPSDGMLELAPGKSQVQDVVPGPESSEFVFCDNAVYYIPISATNPLKPGSVAFQVISSDGSGTVQPQRVGEIIVFADQGLTQLYSIVAVGSYTRPYETHPLTDLHAHLFNNIQTIALPSSVTQFPERYAYVLNGDGTLAVGKYVLDDSGKLSTKIGWLPWSGAGAVAWVSALNDVVLFVTAYNVSLSGSGGGTGSGGATLPFSYMLEQLDATLYLDASLPINAIPAALTPPGGKGPLWWLPGVSVDLMDGTFPLGPHAVDANGFVTVNQPGEDMSTATLRAGFAWTAVFEPFLPPVQGGADSGQRMKKRRCARFEVYVAQSSGFSVRQIYTGQQGPNLPALGSYIGGHRIPAYNQDDDASKAPPLREQGYTFRPRGRAHDPRNAIVKDTPGPLTVVEISMRASV